MAIITLTVKELNAPIKTNRVVKWMKERRPVPMLPTRDPCAMKWIVLPSEVPPTVHSGFEISRLSRFEPSRARHVADVLRRHLVIMMAITWVSHPVAPACPAHTRPLDVLSSWPSPRGRHCYHPHFADEEMQAQRDEGGHENGKSESLFSNLGLPHCKALLPAGRADGETDTQTFSLLPM